MMKVAAYLLWVFLAAGGLAAEPRVFQDCADCPPMVTIPAGVFIMGTIKPTEESAEHPAEHDLPSMAIAQPFAMGRFEVTRREFARFAAATKFVPASACRTWDDKRAGFVDRPVADWRKPGFPAQVLDDQPVTCVSWFDARAYARWLSETTGFAYRLPSEAEWEYAAKAGTQTLRFWGDDAADGCDYANTYDQTAERRYPLGWEAAACEDGEADLASVGRYQPN